MILSDLLRLVQSDLTQGGIESAARDARLLVAAACDIKPDRLTLEANSDVTEAMIEMAQHYTKARLSHEPVSRILGRRLFWGRWFDITPDVLDPRGDTETLIALALEKPFETALDLGSGSGCIAITIATETSADVVATDISQAALNVAQHNASIHEAQITFQHSDWFDRVEGRFDLIVSNPPYISETEMSDLDPDVALFDPHIALTPGGDGLLPYREIAGQAQKYLTDRGRILVEIGHMQARDVMGFFEDAGFAQVTCHRDLNGKDRVIEALLTV